MPDGVDRQRDLLGCGERRGGRREAPGDYVPLSQTIGGLNLRAVNGDGPLGNKTFDAGPRILAEGAA
jgi:hypothetical protein